MVENSYDVIVVGGGPAGSVCATLLAKMYYNVLLVDKEKFPRDKPCGDAISFRSMSVLEKIGVTKKMANISAKMHGIIISSPDGTSVEFPFEKIRSGKQLYFYCSRRKDFDNILLKNAKKYSTVIEQLRVYDLIFDDDKVIGVKGTDVNGNKKEFFSKIVVGADGALSVVGKKIGITPDKSNLSIAIRSYFKGVKNLSDKVEFYYTNLTGPGYFWIFPVWKNIANVGVGMPLRDKKNSNLHKIMYDAINNHPVLKKRFENARQISPVKGWNLPCGSRKKLHGNGVLLIGDAASLIEHFSGEGIGNALVSAEIASQAIDLSLKSGDTSSSFLKKYTEEINALLGSEFKKSYYLQRIATWKFLFNMVLHKSQKSYSSRDLIASTFISKPEKKSFFKRMKYMAMLFARLLINR